MTTRQIYIVVLGTLVLASMAITAIIIIKGYTRSDGVIAIGAFALGALATMAHEPNRKMIWPDDMPKREEPETLVIPPPFDGEEDKNG